MGQRKQIEDRERLQMLLRAVSAHPWARAELIHSQSGLRQGEFDAAIRMARRYRLVTMVDIHGLGQTPARYGVTRAGANRAHAYYSGPWQQKTLLATLKLDYARALVNAWFAAPGLVWALSPFLLPARALRPAHPRSESKRDYAGLAYRSLRLDGLACLRLAAREYLNVALLTDPGYLRPEWFYQTFRSAHAWRRRSEFRRQGNTYFPVFVVITTDEQRLTQVADLWRETVADGDWPGLLRLTTLEGLRRDRWWNERRQVTALWGGVVTCTRPSRRPALPFSGWWGDSAPDEVAANEPAPIDSSSTLTASQSIGMRTAGVKQLLEIHQTISLKARELLDRVGQYPLISSGDLAAVMAFSDRHVQAGMQELVNYRLVEVLPPTQGHVLTWLGLCLLAAQVGIPPIEYARHRGWPLEQTQAGTVYAVGWLDAVRAHTNLVLDFLVGLCRHGAPRLTLVRWDHVQCLFELPARSHQEQISGLERLRAIAPDATGTVQILRSNGSLAELPFWLEVDRGSIHGQKLADKLTRYYQLGGTWDGLAGNLPRLLIMVERGGEGRLQTLCRRLRMLNERFRTQLDVRLSRADLLADEHDRLNPTKPAWRTVDASKFVDAFEA
jgi:hypothetical protein